MTHLTLYTTLGCHLCEQLEALLQRLHRGEYELRRIEISEDEGLLARYGVRIPVLADEAGEELDMGFEASRLATWLAERNRLDEGAWQQLNTGESDPLDQGEKKADGALNWRPGGRRYLA